MAALTATDLVTIFTNNINGLAPYNNATILDPAHFNSNAEKQILAVVEVIHAAMAALTNDVEAKLLRTMVEKMLADITDSAGVYAVPADVSKIADDARLHALEYMNRPSTPKTPDVTIP